MTKRKKKTAAGKRAAGEPAAKITAPAEAARPGPASITGDHVPPLESLEKPEPAAIVAPEPAPEPEPPAEEPESPAPLDPKGRHEVPAPGLECPKCGCRHFEVLYTRPMFGGRIQRRRQCRHCGRRMTTLERKVSE